MSFSLLFGVLVEFGLNQQLVRAIARDQGLAGSVPGQCTGNQTCTGGRCLRGILVLIDVLGYSAEAGWVIAIYCLILALNAVSTTFTAVYQGTQHVVYAAVGSIIEKVLVCALAITLLWLGLAWPLWPRCS